MRTLTGGASLRANVALLRHNARVAAQLAVAMASHVAMSAATPEPSPGQVTETGAPPDRQSPEARNDPAALPIARRIAATTFPLWWRPSSRRRAHADGRLVRSRPALVHRRQEPGLAVRRRAERSPHRPGARRAPAGVLRPHHPLPRRRARSAARSRISRETRCGSISSRDTGDGWNSTYAVAFAAAQRSLALRRTGWPRRAAARRPARVRRRPGVSEREPRGVPAAARRARSPRPSATTSRPSGRTSTRSPAITTGTTGSPRSRGCSAPTSAAAGFAGWWTRQRRSYFVLKLPHGWWLIGSDGQLQSDLDVPQMEHFREIAARYMKPGDKVILCLSLPAWIYAQKYRTSGLVFDETDLIFLREEVFARLGVDVKVYLAGDLHHYRRHEETRESAGGAEPVQKITAGGGGAFLHPTHEEDVSVLSEEAVTETARARTFALKCTYPDMKRSARLAWQNLNLPVPEPALRHRAGVASTCSRAGSSARRCPTRCRHRRGARCGSRPTRSPRTRASRSGRWAIVGMFLAFTDTHSRAVPRDRRAVARRRASGGDVLHRLERARARRPDLSRRTGFSAPSLTGHGDLRRAAGWPDRSSWGSIC